MCFFFLSAETSFCLKICFVHSWTISTMTLAVGRSHLASTVFSFCCHGAEAVSVVWATCAGAHGSLINVMYRRNCSEEQEVLAKKKIERHWCWGCHVALNQFCRVHTNTVTLANTHMCTRCFACRDGQRLNINRYYSCAVLFFSSSFPFKLTRVQGADSAAPILPSVGVSQFRYTFPSPGHCHVPGPTEQRGL